MRGLSRKSDLSVGSDANSPWPFFDDLAIGRARALRLRLDPCVTQVASCVGEGGRIVLLDKLESGFLRFETPQGLAAAEPTFWQRVYLLWTFRNFHQLSPLLLNPRQIALINNLFRQHTVMGPDEYEPLREIGIVENFVPSAMEIETTPSARTDASRTMKSKPSEQAAGQSVAARVMPMAASSAVTVEGRLALNREKAKKEGAGIDCVETAPRYVLDRSCGPIVFWLRFALSNLATSRLLAARQVMFGFAAAVATLSLCAYFSIAWHRVRAPSGSQAHNSVPQLTAPPGSPSAPTPTPGVANLPATPEKPAESVPDQEAPVKPSPAKVASSITLTQQMMTPERESRVPTARVARSRGGSHAAAFSGVPMSRSNRRMTLAPGSRGANARSSKSYFDLADRQLHQGKYAAATANYKRAWRIEGRIAAANGRRARARLARQAERESIANRIAQ
jgi:hypothetical protein